MPELPEVEASRRVLMRALRGRTIVAAWALDDPIVFDQAPPRAVAAALRGRRARAVRRWGKHLWLELDRRPWPAFHFGMTGSFVFYARPRDRPPHARLEMVLDDGRRIAFRDPRRFGRIHLHQDPRQEPPISRLGFDPLLGAATAAELRHALARRRAPLKAVLLDQSVFAGVGNWVADEVLYQARLSPTRPASSLTSVDVARLRRALHAVLETAVAVNADSDRFPPTWLFHDRWGKRAGSLTARGEAIAHTVVGGRTTAWVPSRQR